MKTSSVTRSNCEKDFALNAIDHGIRLDGRKHYDFRKLRISFGESFGHCEVCLGNTRCLAQVTCEVVKPKQNRATEGQLFLNLELSPMASPAFESGRPSDYSTEMNRFIERCLRESRPIDLESLCILAGEKVWCLRVDIQVLDDAGNILDCACIAAITALAHFRRPDVSVHGKDVTIHPPEDKEPIPLNVHHIPVCVTFGFIEQRDTPIIDPTELEEIVIDGHMTMAMNSHSEICCAKMAGVPLHSDQIMTCCNVAIAKVEEITELIRKCLEKDNIKRFPPKDFAKRSVGDDIKDTAITKTVAEPTNLDVTESSRVTTDVIGSIKTNRYLFVAVSMTALLMIYQASDIGNIGDAKSSSWVISDDDGSDDEMIENNTEIRSKEDDYIILDDAMESEEEETVQLTSEDLGLSKGQPIEVDNENIDPETSINDKSKVKNTQQKPTELSSKKNNQNNQDKTEKKKKRKKKVAKV
eukprot:gene6964-7748_t